MRRLSAIARSAALSLSIVLVLLLLTSCYGKQERAYYTDRSNYITDVAIVDNIIYKEDTEELYLWLSEIDDVYQDSTFKMQGENVSIVMSSGILEKVDIGSEITFVSAPEYFGDGYCMPIVGLSVNGEELLTFDEGIENLIAQY